MPGDLQKLNFGQIKSMIPSLDSSVIRWWSEITLDPWSGHHQDHDALWNPPEIRKFSPGQEQAGQMGFSDCVCSPWGQGRSFYCTWKAIVFPPTKSLSLVLKTKLSQNGLSGSSALSPASLCSWSIFCLLCLSLLLFFLSNSVSFTHFFSLCWGAPRGLPSALVSFLLTFTILISPSIPMAFHAVFMQYFPNLYQLIWNLYQDSLPTENVIRFPDLTSAQQSP